MPDAELGKFAIIADIHGNADALRAVIEDMARHNLDAVVNLGDCLSGPLAARETAEILMASRIISIRGNHDRWLVEQQPSEMGPSDRAAHEQLDPRHLDWLAGLPEVLCFSGGLSGDVFLCHGTPNSDVTYWMEQVLPSGMVTMRSHDAIAAEAAGLDASLILCGHTHIPRLVRLATGQVILNPGSIGCPAYTDDQPVFHVMETGSPAASYAIAAQSPQGWAVSFHQVPYDTRRMVDLARRAGRDDWATALGTGWLRQDWLSPCPSSRGSSGSG
ncbi:metallophosphoesterase family protein [Paracoccus caeni]|uniref:Metallophosphoesterase family protein n=1 Tax=Paracoccus caeni TaxID=657651 RepID=A0A934S9B0_9RHOB|nr:metallophosphoesterase family protein [Paracoccus caeni]MBK4214506.1 metallophosphoesterase family protein [Paracoccus caeni]